MRAGLQNVAAKRTSDGYQNQSAPRSPEIRDREVLPGCKFRYQCRCNYQQREGSLQQEQQNQRNEDGGRDDPFHDFKQDTRCRLLVVSSSLS